MSLSNLASLHISQDRGSVSTYLVGHDNLLGHQNILRIGQLLTENDLESFSVVQSATGLSAYNRIEQLWANVTEALVRIGEGADEGGEEVKGRGG